MVVVYHSLTSQPLAPTREPKHHPSPLVPALALGAPLASCPVVRLVLDRFGAVLLVLAVTAGAAEPTVEPLECTQQPDGAVCAQTYTHDQPWRVNGHRHRQAAAAAARPPSGPFIGSAARIDSIMGFLLRKHGLSVEKAQDLIGHA